MTYSVEKLKLLRGLEAVRKRPGMYIGSTDKNGLHQLIWEIFDNAIDEAIAGFANEISLIINSDNSIEISDNGRGIPTEIHKKTGKTGVELVFSELHSGAKFSTDIYKTAGGLHGVGSSVVNALSEKLEVYINRDKKLFYTSFINGGKIETRTKIIGKSTITGTKIRFWPDFSLFSHSEFDSEMIISRLRETCFLINSLKINFFDTKNNIEKKFLCERGIESFIEFLNNDQEKINDKIITFKEKMQEIIVEFGFQYVNSQQENIISFVNNVKTNLGGSHENGFKSGFLKAINTYGQQNNLLKTKQILEFSDAKVGLSAVLSLRIPESILEFVGQTKNKLSTILAKTVTEEVIFTNLMTFFALNKEVASKIINFILETYTQRQKSKLSIIESKTSKSITKEKRILSGKLTPANSKKAMNRELFLVEGESAGGSAKLARNREFQAILPLKGKIVNAQKTRLIDLLKNEEIIAIISALGTGIGQNFNLKNLNYGKIIIMTDADNDGAHIQILILTFLFLHMRPLIEKGFVYIAQPPLYRISEKGRKDIYIWDEEKFEKYIKNSTNLQIQRYKGLGEMNANQLWQTTMDPERRTLEKVLIENYPKVEENFQILMGERADLRKSWIEKNVDFSLEDKFIENLKETIYE
ncbi:DNA gyrase/topoisomerase IV subunit B [Mesomycoplasma hyopneumoniae]|uniref:DNA gyrase/topoisomerase IV subunit B n=1 Tax=Mesomycoplasma hyopneumoniae TaxID=2099 RepID=UPI00136E0A58|nr:type IIA DNA topoisomerase subunit B [Mesomycoplasma hyopneumoniae]MXR34813.1 type IIA DNA topoisomerase subunit B [Mesomycoplasma hyopneumoniae]MXR44568.1 type IIA DNA topoisomerase subunit B [Mesomycoplasma hyopneumoniae]